MNYYTVLTHGIQSNYVLKVKINIVFLKEIYIEY